MMDGRSERTRRVQDGREMDLGLMGPVAHELVRRIIKSFEIEGASGPRRRLALRVSTPDLIEVPSLMRDGVAREMDIPNAQIEWVSKERDILRVMDRGTPGKLVVVTDPHMSFRAQYMIGARWYRDRPGFVILTAHPIGYYEGLGLWRTELTGGCEELFYPRIERRSADFFEIVQRALQMRNARKEISPEAVRTLETLPLRSPKYGVSSLVAIADRLIAAVPGDTVSEEAMYEVITAIVPGLNVARHTLPTPAAPPPQKAMPLPKKPPSQDGLPAVHPAATENN